jgi:hypothetical protein
VPTTQGGVARPGNHATLYVSACCYDPRRLCCVKMAQPLLVAPTRSPAGMSNPSSSVVRELSMPQVNAIRAYINKRSLHLQVAGVTKPTLVVAGQSACADMLSCLSSRHCCCGRARIHLP